MAYFPFFIDIENANGLKLHVITQDTTSGASPVVTMDVKKHLQEWLPDNIEEILEWMEMIRLELKAVYPNEKERAKVSRMIYESMVRGKELN